MDDEITYQNGDLVLVRVDSPVHHYRTPKYIQGKRGKVKTCHGAFPNPESLAHGGSGLPLKALYQVEFDQIEIWPGYEGPPADKIFVDIYEHWLNPAE